VQCEALQRRLFNKIACGELENMLRGEHGRRGVKLFTIRNQVAGDLVMRPVKKKEIVPQ